MRRNMPSRSHGAGAGGPLVTDHLQLHDIDLELELLKRKREMIEKQQQMLSGPSFNRPKPFEYDNGQPRPLFQGIQEFNPNLGFSRYNEPQQSNSYGAGGLLGKRPMNNHQPWQNTSMLYSGHQGGAKRKFNSGPGPKMNQPSSEPKGPNKPFAQNRNQWNKPQPNNGSSKSNFPSQRFNNSKTTKPAQTDFKPSKVSKPKPNSPPHKFGSYPTPHRARPVNNARHGPKRDFNEDADFILRTDKVPSQQLAGRLELGLGQILKDIKAKYGTSEAFTVNFQSVFLQRQMKQAIRERLRSVMMGKYVGKIGEVVGHYRKVFPAHTDAEIVKIAMDAHNSAEAKQLAIKLESAGTTYKYIKNNINRLLGVTLDDIFAKVHTLYENENESTRDICTKILAEKIPNTSGDNENQEAIKEKEETCDNKEFIKEEEEEIGANESKDVVTSEPAEGVNNESISEQNDTKTDVMGATDAEIAENVNKSVETAEAQTKDEIMIEGGNDDDESHCKNIETSAKLDNLIFSLIKRRMPFILPKYKNMLMKILNASYSFRVTKDAILETAQQRLDVDKRVQEAEKSFAEKSISDSNVDTTNNADSASPSLPKPPAPYIVKILGRPVLPKRKIMQEFLNDFKPSSVKKHRTMHLLFVSFSNKDDYHRIVGLKETTLGDCTISIRASDKTVGKVEEPVNTPPTSLNESAEDTTISSDPISSDLDEQINDLLLSIRKEEEINDNVTSETGLQDDANAGETEAKANDVDTNAVAEVMDTNAEAMDTNAEVMDTNAVAEVVDTNEEAEVMDTNENVKEVTPAVPETNTEAQDEAVSEEAKDKVEELKSEAKESGRTTPARASARLANVTPSSVRTRRASRLANNN